MTQESLLPVLIAAIAWVALELLKYIFSRTFESATKRRNNNSRNPGNSNMSAGELRTHFVDVKNLLQETRDAAMSAKFYAKQALEATKEKK